MNRVVDNFKNNIVIVISILIPCLLSSCSILQTSYPLKLTNSTKYLKRDNINLAVKAYQDQFNIQSRSILNLLTIGRLYQLDGKYQLSLREYALAVKDIRSYQNNAKIQFSKLYSNSLAIIGSDRELPYIVPSFEQIFLYIYQAKNYLNLDDLNNALVSVRKLSQAQSLLNTQRKLSHLYTKKIDDKVDMNLNNNSLLNRNKTFLSMKEQVETINNSVENAFAYYLESILYESDNFNYNDSFISIKNARNLVTNNKYINETYQQMQMGFNGRSPFYSGQGRVVVFFESGLVQQKETFSLRLLLGNLGVQFIFIPYYKGNNDLYLNSSSQVVITNKRDKSKIITGKMFPLTNTNLLARRALVDQYPLIITREILRIIFKSSLTYSLHRNMGTTGLVAGSLYSILTSSSDLRSWLLLPKTIDLYQCLVKPGDYTLKLNNKIYNFRIYPFRTTLIWVTRIGLFMKGDVYNL